MSLKPQNIRTGVTILIDKKEISKEKIIKLSEGWNETKINFFKKMLKQGGIFTLNGNNFQIKTPPPILTSRGEKDAGIIVIPGIDERY